MSNDSNIRDQIVSSIYTRAKQIADSVTDNSKESSDSLTQRIDDIVTSKAFGLPIMILLLAGVLWITISGANAPSALLAKLLFTIEDWLTNVFTVLHAPDWLHGLLVLGMYRSLAWVVSVMLPPMAIFFPLFTLLEDLGYLPRIAFNLDHLFKRVGAHGKQALTMTMGFGCNAAGVIAARIIDSPRERILAILTNNFVPCNGRFPILITMATLISGISVSTIYGGLMATLFLVGAILLGVGVTLVVTLFLSRTVLKGEPSSFALELPPYRIPQVGKVLVRAFFDRTLFVLWRAVKVAAPAGILTWVLANIYINDTAILHTIAHWLDPIAVTMGLDGMIILAFLLGLPANEIVIPIILMGYLSTGTLIEVDNMYTLHEILVNNGWTWLTAVNVMLFSLMHFPCGTTLLTIQHELGSKKWTAIAAVLPTLVGIITCFMFTQLVRLLGLV